MEIYEVNLSSENKNVQLATLVEIYRKLKSISVTGEYDFFFAMNLIDGGVAWTLCRLVMSPDDRITRVTLSILEILMKYDNFYINQIPQQAINDIIQRVNAIAPIKNRSIQDIVQHMCIVLHAMINRGCYLNIPVYNICNTDQLLDMISGLSKRDGYWQPSFTSAVVNLFAIILPHVQNPTYPIKIVKIARFYKFIIGRASQILQNFLQDVNSMDKNILASIMIICNTGLRIYRDGSIHYIVDSSKKPHRLDPNVEYKNAYLTILNTTRDTFYNSVIPNSISSDITLNLNSITSRNFIESLCELYKQTDVKRIAMQLAKYGYLLYFGGLLLKTTPSDCESICELLVYIVENISTKYLSLNKFTNGIEGFRRFLKNGFMTITHFTSNYEPALKDSLLILIYIHFQIAQNFDIHDFMETIKKMDMSTKIMSLSEDNPPEIPILQVILFLFSVVALNTNWILGGFDELFPSALSRITTIVTKVKFGNCCTYSLNIPLPISQNTIIPRDISESIVKCWLKHNGEIFVLLIPGPSHAIINYALNKNMLNLNGVSHQCSLEFKQLMDYSVNPAISTKEQIIQATWTNLPLILNSYTFQREMATKLYLDIIDLMKIDNLLRDEILFNSIKSIIDIFLRSDINLKMDMNVLLIKQASKIIYASYLNKNVTVALQCVNSYKFLEKVCSHAFISTQDNLATASFSCLTELLRCQLKLSIRCFKPVLLKQSHLYAPLMPRDSSYYNVLHFYNRMWTSDLVDPIIVFDSVTEEEFKELLLGMYRMYCAIHLSSPESHWVYTFHCMSNFLKYLNIKNFYSILCDCCQYICNSNVTQTAIESAYTNNNFFDFVRIWIRFSIERGTQNIHIALGSKEQRTQTQTIINHYEIPFIKCLLDLRNYIYRCLDMGYIIHEKVEDLIGLINELL